MRPHSLARAIHFLVLASASWLTQANNILVTNTQLVGNTGTTVQVQFDISWNNSWRTSVDPNNWDAAWIFIKWMDAAGVYGHVRPNTGGHVIPGGATFDLGVVEENLPHDPGTNPYVGGFLYRSTDGGGTFSLTGMQIQWDYAALGLSYAEIAQVQVFAIEMVYVPQGAFYVGSGGTESNSYTDGSWTSGASIPFLIDSEGPITKGQNPGKLFVTGSSSTYMIGPTLVIPAEYPKGFASFYCMKYEISARLWTDFLNTLTYDEQNECIRSRTNGPTSPPTVPANNGIAPNAGPGNRIWSTHLEIVTPGVASTTPAVFGLDLDNDGIYNEPEDGNDAAMTRLWWSDLSIFLDWSGLRPISGFEFEKACRGKAAPVPNEYAWGTSAWNAVSVTVQDQGTASERVTSSYGPGGNAALGQYPQISTSTLAARVGVWADHPENTGRVTSGASYYGIMELTGNAVELVTSPWMLEDAARGNIPINRSGIHGNGDLSTSYGLPVDLDWPKHEYYDGANWVTRGMDAMGGGETDWTGSQNGRICQHGNIFGNAVFFAGGRGVRTAP